MTISQESGTRIGLVDFLTALQSDLGRAFVQGESDDNSFSVDAVTLEVDVSCTFSSPGTLPHPTRPQFWVERVNSAHSGNTPDHNTSSITADSASSSAAADSAPLSAAADPASSSTRGASAPPGHHRLTIHLIPKPPTVAADQSDVETMSVLPPSGPSSTITA